MPRFSQPPGAFIGALAALFSILPSTARASLSEGFSGGTGRFRWECKPSTWKAKPQLQDGVFGSQLEAECDLGGLQGNMMPRLAEAIGADLRNHRTVHQESPHTSEEGLTGILFDTTLALPTDRMKIRETAFLATRNHELLLYRTESKQIEASGTAGYLRSVTFSSKITPDATVPSLYRLRFTNGIEVERPWFAIPFLFQSIAANTAVDKFDVALRRVMDLLTKELERETETPKPSLPQQQ